MLYWSLNLFCLKLCNVTGHTVSCLALDVFGLLYNCHVTLKETQSEKEAVCLPLPQNYSHLRFLPYVANPVVV